MVLVFIGNRRVYVQDSSIEAQKPWAWGQAGHELLLTQPILRAAKEGEADEPAYP